MRVHDGDEVTQLRVMVQERDEKIATMNAEFDVARGDFRSTLDTLELATVETERVYEKRVQDLLQERRMLLEQNEDVQGVVEQFHQLELVVQELEEGLEDARRGEAEARGEVEFLRGEVERVRAELRREREKNEHLTNGTESSHVPAQVLNPAPASTQVSAQAATGDADKWCALCEEDGHDSISCPYEKT